MAVEKAFLRDEDGNKLDVHFNPETLTLPHQTTGEQGMQRLVSKDANGKESAGRATVTTGYRKTLSLNLLFDTSESDDDVRKQTEAILQMTRPVENKPPIVSFEWGTFSFEGHITSVTETLSYFSEQGKPLRADVSLSMTGADAERASNSITSANSGLGFSASASLSASIGAGANASLGASVSAGVSANGSIGTTPLTFSQGGESLQALAGRAGLDWKTVAQANDIDDPRALHAGSIINFNVK